MASTRVLRWLLLCQFGLALPAAGQRPPDTQCTVPVSLPRPNSSVADYPESVTLKIRWGKAKILREAVFDHGSRRIAVVLDGTKFIHDEAWRLETSLANSIVQGARSEDNIALVILSDNPETLGFGTARSGLLKRLAELATARPAHRQTRHLYDSFVQSVQLFSDPQFGDALFYIGGGIDHNSANTLKDTSQVLLDHGIRIFGLLLTGMLTDTHGNLLQDTHPESPAVSFMELARESGGLLYYKKTETEVGEFKLTPEVFKSYWETVAAAYAQAANLYRVTLPGSPSSSGTSLRIGWKHADFSTSEQEQILYPRRKWECPAESR